MNLKYERKSKLIYDIDDKSKPVFTGKSINEAKRESRRLQGSALGQGLLRVIG